MRQWHKLTLAVMALAAFALAQVANAEDLIMARSQQPFPEAMLALQDAITHHGYVLSRVQRVDVGLTRSGFKTDKYRVVFFGKPAQIRELAHDHPELIPYLPLKIAIFAEGNQTVLVAANPRDYDQFFPHDHLRALFAGWARDLQSIMDEVRKGN
ncbi:MAG: DUF302 domain-containing protein [Gammaproteobacteria bacterium]